MLDSQRFQNEKKLRILKRRLKRKHLCTFPDIYEKSDMSDHHSETSLPSTKKLDEEQQPKYLLGDIFREL